MVAKSKATWARSDPEGGPGNPSILIAGSGQPEQKHIGLTLIKAPGAQKESLSSLLQDRGTIGWVVLSGGTASLEAQLVKNMPAMKTRIRFLGREDLLEEGTTTHSSILAWRIPWTEGPGELQSMGQQRAGHNCRLPRSLEEQERTAVSVQS